MSALKQIHLSAWWRYRCMVWVSGPSKWYGNRVSGGKRNLVIR